MNDNISGKARAIKYLVDNPKASTKDTADAVGCSRRTVRRAKAELRESNWLGKTPRILIFDIETAPMEVYAWRTGEQYVGPQNIIKDWSFLSWAGKWLYEPEIMSAVVTPEEAHNREDYSIIQPLWDLFEEALIIIGHNCNSFDIKKANTRFLMNGLKPPMPYQTVDTLQVARRYFDFSSNKLDFLNLVMDRKRKLETNYDLWKRCVNYDDKALEYMRKYNCGDITATEELYLELRPWVKSHPNLGLYFEADGNICPNCGSDKLNWKGKYYTPAGRFNSFRCACGAIGRSRFSDLSKKEKAKLTISIAR